LLTNLQQNFRKSFGGELYVGTWKRGVQQVWSFTYHTWMWKMWRCVHGNEYLKMNDVVCGNFASVSHEVKFLIRWKQL
jgi:hypothetical protein